METAKHYVCLGGCRGVSEEPVKCGSETCAYYTLPLEECDCTDGRHGGVFELEDAVNGKNDQHVPHEVTEEEKES